MLALIGDIRSTAQGINPNFQVWVNGGEELYNSPYNTIPGGPVGPSDYLNVIDGMYKEQVLYDPGKENTSNRLYEKAMLDNCKNAGKPVILIEYVTGTTKVSDVKTTCASWGYGYYIANPNSESLRCRY